MLITGPSICGVDTCPHCTRETGCRGIIYLKWYAERDLRADAHALIERGRKYGFAITVEINRAPGVTPAAQTQHDRAAGVKEGGNG